MKRFLTFIRRLLHTVFFITVLLGIALTVIVHYNLAGKLTKNTVTPYLCEKLNTKVEIGEVEVNWLNQVAIEKLVVFDQHDDTLLYARRAMVAFEAWPLIKRQLVINAIQLINFEGHIKQASLDDEPNFKFIVDALAPRKENKKRQFINDLSIHSLHLRQGSLTYDVGKQRRKLSFTDYRHLRLTDITAALQLEISHITGMELKVKRFSMKEVNGMTLAGNGWMKNDSVQANVEQLLVDCALPVQAEMKAKVAFNINQLTKANYSAEIVSANTTVEALKNVNELFDLHLQPTLLRWAEKAQHISLSGKSVGIGADSICYNGTVSTSGALATKLHANAQYLQQAEFPISAEVEGRIMQLPYRQYYYHNIDVKGAYKEGAVQAKVDAHDNNCDAVVQAVVQLGEPLMLAYQANLRHVEPFALHLTSWQNADGVAIAGTSEGQVMLEKKERLPYVQALMHDLVLSNANDTLRLEPIRLDIDKEENTYVGILNAPFAQCVMTPTALVGCLPTNQELCEFLKLPGYLSKQATLTGEWDSVAHVVAIEANVPELTTNEGVVTMMLTANGESEEKSPMPKLVNTHLALDYITPKHLLSTALVANIQPTPLLVDFEESEISLDGHPFSLSDARIEYNETQGYRLNNFELNNGEQHLWADGSFKSSEQIDLDVDLNDFQIDFFVDMLGKSYLDFGGYATGHAEISTLPILHIEADSLFIRKFSYIEKQLGDNTLSGYWDLKNDNLFLEAAIDHGNEHVTHAKGEVRMGGERSVIDFLFQPRELPVEFLSNWVGGFLQDLHGTATGDVRMYGRSDQLNFEGTPVADINFTHSLLGGRYYLNDTVFLGADATGYDGYIELHNAKLNDRFGQTAIANVEVNHHHLEDFLYDVDVQLPNTQNGFMVFDHPQQKSGELYWGQLWANGRAQLHGTTTRHRIGVQMTTAGKSTLYLSPGEENFSDNSYNFLTFRDKATLTYNGDEWEMLSRVRTSLNSKDEEESYVEADLQVHANDRCLVNLQLDPLAEDRLLCRGEGDILLHYDSDHDISLNGQYDISQGSYTVTMKGDFMSKSFQLQKGSSVAFSGSPSQADLNLQAVYSVPSANLRDLDESFASMASLNRTSLPVDCELNLTGTLSAPQIAFDLKVKNVSDDVQAMVHNLIGTQEMLNREVFYLLLFSKFYTPEYATSAQTNTSSQLSSFASATLTSQLNNLLGHMSDNFTLGTNIRSDKGDFSDMEMDLSLQTRLFSDRLLLSGNLGYRDPNNRIGMNNTNNAFIGDFDIEFLINTSGTLRAKAYSHYNERAYSINNALTTQGIGIIVRRDFNSIKELLKLKKTK